MILEAYLMRYEHSTMIFIHCLDFNYEDDLEVFALGHGLLAIMLFFQCYIPIIRRIFHYQFRYYTYYYL